MAKILLVEDDNNLREIYQARLQAEGYTIVSARDGEEALVVAKAEKPDLIIADVMMPKISGFEMLDIIRNTDGLKEVKVIMLTALGQSDDQKRADKLGADRYLVKSQVTLEDIVKAAQDLLGATESAETAAPAPEAPAAPTPDTAAPPAAATAKVEVTGASAETAKQEAADAEAKIEDFVAGATSEPTVPGAAPTPPPAAPAPTVVPAPPAPATPPASAADDSTGNSKTSDDTLMANAVDTLNASADAQAAPIETPGSPKTDATPIEDEKKSEAGSKKIIKPIESEDKKKDIHTLLAEEEAKEAAGSASTLNPPTPQASDTDADDTKPADPNSIAL